MGIKLDSALTPKTSALHGPDPTRYNPNGTFTRHKSPEFKIGTSQRGGNYDPRKAKLVPAPGTYELKSKAFDFEKPHFYMGQRIEFDDTKKFIHSLPGPGTHETAFYKTKYEAPRYSMGKKLDSCLTPKTTRTLVPGPGSYRNEAQKLKLSAPSFGFGTSKRPEIGGNKKMLTPGPGAYKLPSKIADTPNYNMPNRSLESKFV